MKVKDCPECTLHYFDTPALVEACASVALERGTSLLDILLDYLASYHYNGHEPVKLDEGETT